MNGVVAIYIFGGFLFLFIIIHYYRQYTSNATKEQDKLTRIQTECPDFWVVEESNKCRNTHKLGKCLTRDNGGLMDFNTDYFQNKDSGNYAKCRWAKTCNVSWDGIDHICI
jgi:hypothetical protein